MKTGPYLFAAAALASATLLPKTGWVVRNEIDLMMGRWSDPGVALGMKTPLGLAPLWAFEPDSVDDPMGKAVSESMVQHESAGERWARIRPLMRDPKVREASRAAVLRRAFTTLIASRKDSESVQRMRGFIKELRPLAAEGEKADPFNAFYPTCRAVMEHIEGDVPVRDAAIRRASECTYYDDDAWGESKRYVDAFEREHGYRGSVLRITKAGTVLLPQHAQFNRVVRDIAAAAPLDSPQRRQILALGETLMRTGRDKITVYVGRGLLLRAVGRDEDAKDGVDVDRWFAPFERANPGFDTKEAKRLVRAATPEDLLDFGEYETGLSSLATAVGSGLLLAALMALGLAWPARKPFDDGFEARLARANWAWLGVLPAAFADGCPEGTASFLLFTGAAVLAWGLTRAKWGRWPAVAVALVTTVAGLSLVQVGAPMWGVPGLLWLGAALVPERGRAAFAALFLTFAAGGAAWKVVTSHYSPAYLVLGAVLLVLAARKALPSRGGLAVLPAVAASLWLVGLGGELLADAQTGAALERLQRQADDFRRDGKI